LEICKSLRSPIRIVAIDTLMNKVIAPSPSRGRLSEAEPQSNRGSDVVALEKAEGQTIFHLREHDP
jgi:hypothetical protein